MKYDSYSPTDLNAGYYNKDYWFNSIVNVCHTMMANDELVVHAFGSNQDLTLHLYKDEDYNAAVDAEYSDMVFIVTTQNGQAVDDTEDTYVTDGSLYKELERIWNYEAFKTL